MADLRKELRREQVRLPDSSGRRQRRRSLWRVLRRSPLACAGAIIVLIFLIAAVSAEHIAPYPRDASGRDIDLSRQLLSPSHRHLFGTDDLGRDVLSRTVVGTRLSLGLGLAVVCLTAVVGVVLGTLAGYCGGWLDSLIMRVGDILMAIPYMLLVIALVVATGRGLPKMVLAVSLPWWPWYARIVRGEILRIRRSTFIEAARAMGASHLRIVSRHVVPNIVGVVIVQASLQVGRAILAVAALGFLGLGVQPPLVEWGAMVSAGRTYMPTWWWIASFPGLAIFLLGLGFNLLGDGLRDVADPRSMAVR